MDRHGHDGFDPLVVGGVVSLRRDRRLADDLLTMVKACCQPLAAVLVLTDGWSAYPGSIRRAFHEKVKGATGRGCCKRQAWPEVLIGTVITKTAKKRVVEVLRRLTQGGVFAAIALLAVSGGGKQVHTACIKRLNATFRERLARLTRRCRHAARHPSLTFKRACGWWAAPPTGAGLITSEARGRPMHRLIGETSR